MEPLKLGTHIEGWQDMIELLIATWIVFSPFALGFWNNPSAGLTALAIGSGAIFISQLGLAKQQPWEEWANLALATTLIISPWLFGYAAVAIATWSAIVSGGMLATMAIVSMVSEYNEMHQIHGPQLKP